MEDRSRTNRGSESSSLDRMRERGASNRDFVRTITSEALFGGQREIGIDHGGSLYRLKITRQGKLILNK